MRHAIEEGRVASPVVLLLRHAVAVVRLLGSLLLGNDDKLLSSLRRTGRAYGRAWCGYSNTFFISDPKLVPNLSVRGEASAVAPAHWTSVVDFQ